MTNYELIKKIKGLKEIQPSSEWLNLTRQNLINQITREPVEFIPRAGFFNWLRPLQPMALVFCLTLILVAGPWLVSKASQASLPGEALYPIKKVTERIQARVASEGSKTQLQVEFASRRLEELNKINEDSLSSEKKAEKVEEVINDFKDNLAGANLHVKNISKEKAVVIAKKTKKIKEDLNKTKEENPSIVVKEKIIEAEKLVEEINYQILATLAEDSQEESKETSSTTDDAADEETLIFLEEEINFKTITSTDDVIENLEGLESQE